MVTLVLLQLISWAFNLLDFSPFLRVAIWGALIICVTALGRRARRFRRLTALMERGDAFIRPSHVRSNVPLRIYAPTRLRLGPQRRSLSPSLRRPRVARQGPGARSTTWPGVPVTTRRMLDQSKTTASRRSGAGADPFPRLAHSPGCDIRMCVNDRTANAPARALVHRAGFPDPPVLREPFPRWNFLLPTISRAWEAACSTPRRTESIV